MDIELAQALKEIEDLKKENAELNNFIMQSKKDGISPINALIIKNLGDQLIEAKEIMRELVHEISVFYIATDRIVTSPTVKRAELFISKVEK